MKQLNTIGFTDYPIDGQSDDSIHQIKLLAYDRNKYATVQLQNGHITDIKTGYVFQDPTLSKHINIRVWFSLPTELDGAIPTRKQVQANLKAIWKRKTYYKVYVASSSLEVPSIVKRFNNMMLALRYCACQHNISSVDQAQITGKMSKWVSIMDREHGVVYSYTRRKSRYKIKNRHIRLMMKRTRKSK